jgi:hypothetical protein
MTELFQPNSDIGEKGTVRPLKKEKDPPLGTYTVRFGVLIH